MENRKTGKDKMEREALQVEHVEEPHQITKENLEEMEPVEDTKRDGQQDQEKEEEEEEAHHSNSNCSSSGWWQLQKFSFVMVCSSGSGYYYTLLFL